MEWFKRLIEKLYYKAFPDRINEHDLATQPIEPLIIKEERRDIVNLEAIVKLPQEAIERDMIPIEWIRKELSSKIERMIEPEIDIRAERDPLVRQVMYRGYIRIVKREES